MSYLFGVFLSILASTLAKTVPRVQTADYLAEIPKYLELTKELELKRISVAEAFPNYALYDVDIDEVDFVFYNREDTKGTKVAIEDADEITKMTTFDKDLETIFLIHGWQNTCSSSVCQLVHDSLLKKLDYNYITVCWDIPAAKAYLEAHAAVAVVGQYLGDFIKNMSDFNDYDLSKIRLVGHSLGAHIAGWAGKENNGQLSYIIGLDPAGPLFFEWDTADRLDVTDAQYVQAIHTDGVPFRGLGVNYAVGDLDFWPNGGAGQPGCGFDALGMCAHSRSYQLYAESITNNTFVSRQCTSYKDYTEGLCKENSSMLLGGYEFPKLSDNIRGDYYLETNSASPYGLGDIGL